MFCLSALALSVFLSFFFCPSLCSYPLSFSRSSCAPLSAFILLSIEYSALFHAVACLNTHTHTHAHVYGMIVYYLQIHMHIHIHIHIHIHYTICIFCTDLGSVILSGCVQALYTTSHAISRKY